MKGSPVIRDDLPPRLTDYVWLGIASVFSAFALAGLYAWALDARRVDDLGGLGWALAGLAVLLASAGWLVVSSWRRTCWGAPPGGKREERERKRAQAADEGGGAAAGE